MTFKYRFILSFVLIEVFFIILVVGINFTTINNLSNKLLQSNINTKVTFYKDFLKVPLSIYDLATLDNILDKAYEDTIINSIVVINEEGSVLSKNYNFNHKSLQGLIKEKNNKVEEINDEVYQYKYVDIIEEGIVLGGLFIVFDITDNDKFIKQNKKNTMIIIFIEIIISTILSYIIGSKLATRLKSLSKVALEIGENRTPLIPYIREKGEIGILASSLKHMQENLQKANNVKDMFLANMSHEIRTPLNAIIGFVDVLLSSDYSKEKAEEYLIIIKNSSSSLKLIVNDILDYTKISSGKIQINKSEFSLKELLWNIENFFKVQLIEKSISFIVLLDDKIESNLVGDSLRLKQILTNLIGNAIKFTKNGDLKLHISTINKDELKKNIELEFCVEDNGIGISSKAQKKLFESFEQGDLSNTKEYEGTGLGLTISKALVELMGGKIWFESVKNVGSKFYYTLPFSYKKEIKIAEEKYKNEENILIEKKVGLLAEDNKINQKLATKLLQNMGFEIDIANDGIEALALAKTKEYDIIFMDIQMPNMDGLEATKKIRKFNKSIPILALSAAVLPDDEKKAINIGINSYLKKPIDKNEVFREVQNLLG